MVDEPKVTAVIVTYKSRDTIPNAMRTLREANQSRLCECIVVDNDSRDGTVDYLRSEHPWAMVIRNNENVGFGRACNLGFRQVRTPYVLLINPDAHLPIEGLGAMVRFLDCHPNAGIVGPAVRQPDGSLQLAGKLLTPGNVILRAARWPSSFQQRRAIIPGEAPFRTEWLSGSLLLVRKQVLDELSGFDPRFFLYFEDDDLCRRALDRGCDIWALGEVVGEHVHAASAERSQNALYSHCIAEHYFRSRFYYFVKHHGWLKAVATDVLEVIIIAGIGVIRRLMGHSDPDVLVRLRAPILRQPTQT